MVRSSFISVLVAEGRKVIVEHCSGVRVMLRSPLLPDVVSVQQHGGHGSRFSATELTFELPLLM